MFRLYLLLCFIPLCVLSVTLAVRAPRDGRIAAVMAVALFIPGIPLSVWVLYRILRRRSHEYGLVCPSCSNILVMETAAPIVIASGRCCFCGSPLVSDL